MIYGRQHYGPNCKQSLKKVQGEAVWLLLYATEEKYLQYKDVLQLDPLGQEESRALFDKITFIQKKPTPETEDIAKQIISKGEGMSLALVAMASTSATC